MSAAVDRRELLCAAGHIAIGMSVLGTGSAQATSPPPRVPPGSALKIVEGDESLQLPAGASRRLGSPRMRVPGRVNALQFSPRGTTLVAASGSELRAWDPRTGRILFRLNYPQQASVSAGRLTSADSFALLVQPDVGGKYEIRHYAFGNGKSLSESPPLDLGQAQHTAFSVDGARMAVIRQEALHVYDAKGVEKWSDPLPPAAVGGVCFFPDGSTIAVTMKNEVKLYSSTTGKVTSVLIVEPMKASETVGPDQDAGRIAEPVVSAKGKWLAASVGDDGDIVYCWDVNATKRHKFKAAKPIGFTPDESELITFKDSVVTTWTLATGASVRTFDVPTDDGLVLSTDGTILAAAAGDAAILIDAITGKHLPHSADTPGLPSSLRFDRDGHLIGLLTAWGGWIDWDVNTANSRLVRPRNVSGLVPVALSVDGRIALYRKKDEYSTHDMATGKTLLTVKQVQGFNDTILAAAMTPDGQSIVAPAHDGLAITSAKGRKVLRGQGGEQEALVYVIATSADGHWAAVGYRGADQHCPIDVYDLQAGVHLRRLTMDGDVSQLAFAPGGPWLAVAGDSDYRGRRGDNQRTLVVFDPQSSREVLRVTQDTYHEAVFALSPGGRMLARLEPNENDKEADNKIAIWEVLGNSVRDKFKIGGSLSAIAFAPDGRTLAASVHGGPVFLWDLHTPPKDSRPPTPAGLDQAWTDLRAADAARAFEAIRLLARNPAAAVPFLREKVTPVVPPDMAQVKRFIADLDHKEYRRRESAMRGLAELGERVREPLKQALTPGQTPEVRERIERLLAAEDRPTPDYLRRVRAVEAMEVAGTREAGELLAHWAGGAPGALFTRDAEAAVKRLATRTPH